MSIYSFICKKIAFISEGYQSWTNKFFQSAGYTTRSYGTPYDFILSLLPRNLWQLSFVALGIVGLYDFYRDIPLLLLLNNLTEFNLKAIFSAGYLLLFALSTCSILFSFLKYEAIFATQIVAGCIGISLKIFGVIFASPNLVLHIPEVIWAFTIVVAMICANTKYRAHFFPLLVSRRMRTRFFPKRQAGRYRILFIEPALKKDHVASTLRRVMYPFCTPYLAALIPSKWDPMIIDVIFDKIDYDIDTDIVAITAMSLNFKHVQEIAKKFRSKGKTVIFGGADPSRQPDKYLEFCDSVLVGAGEDYLPRMLHDWQEGRLQRKYVNLNVFNLQNMPLPRYDLLPLRRYSNSHNILVSTSCPYHCSFCQYNRTREPRLRPVADVVKAIEATPAKFFWFEAPELLVYKKYIKELDAALSGKRINWATHATMKSCNDPVNLKHAYSAGLRQILIGVESFNTATLQLFNKKMNLVSEYQTVFNLLNKMGISTSIHLIFGSATDEPDDFQKSLVGVIKGKVSAILVHNMSVFAGDEEFEKILIAGGAKEFDGLKKYNMRSRYGVTYYRSQKFTDEQMMKNLNYLHNQFYTLPNIFRRICMRSLRNLPNLLPDLNENIHHSIMRRSHGGYSQDFYQNFAEFVDDSVENVTASFKQVDNQQCEIPKTGNGRLSN